MNEFIVGGKIINCIKQNESYHVTLKNKVSEITVTSDSPYAIGHIYAMKDHISIDKNNRIQLNVSGDLEFTNMDEINHVQPAFRMVATIKEYNTNIVSLYFDESNQTIDLPITKNIYNVLDFHEMINRPISIDGKLEVEHNTIKPYIFALGIVEIEKVHTSAPEMRYH